MKITIIAHPNSRKPRIEEDLLGSIHVYVSEPPLEGRANRAVVDSLTKHFKVNRSQIEMLSGAKSKIKVFEVKE